MAECELCGRNTTLVRTRIEGTIMSLCERCSTHGKRFTPPKSTTRSMRAVTEPETMLVPDFASRILQARQRRRLTLQDAAKQLNEKESVLQHVETGHLRPTENLARKLERFFDVKLYDAVKGPSEDIMKHQESRPLTMGDLLKDKLKR